MEQARKRLVELLSDAVYITSKDSKHPWWERKVTVGAISKNYEYYKYLYCINENYDGKKGVFRIDYDSIWSVFEKENNMSNQQVRVFIESALGDHYNFGDIATSGRIGIPANALGDHYNFGDITTDYLTLD